MQGLGNCVKGLAVQRSARNLGSLVICLQETHLPPGSDSPFSQRLCSHQFNSTYFSYARKVSVLIPNGITFSCLQTVIDTLGQYVFLGCVLDGHYFSSTSRLFVVIFLLVTVIGDHLHTAGILPLCHVKPVLVILRSLELQPVC